MSLQCLGRTRVLKICFATSITSHIWTYYDSAYLTALPDRAGCSSVADRAQRASARNLNANASVADASAHPEPLASSSHAISEADPLSVALDSDDPTMSRSNSIPPGEDVVVHQSHVRGGPAARKDKGKGKERDMGVRIKEEPTMGTLPASEYPATGVSFSYVDKKHRLLMHFCRRRSQPSRYEVKRGSLLFMPLAGGSHLLRWMS